MLEADYIPHQVAGFQTGFAIGRTRRDGMMKL